MQYLSMIYASEEAEAAMQPADMTEMLQEYQEFTKSIVKAGQLKAADRLKPTSSASTVRVRDGKILITDGPFAETREQLGG